MRKKMLVLTALAIAAAMPLTAGADATLMKVASLKNADLLDGTNLFVTQGANGYGLMDMNGNALTGTIYGGSFYFEDNFITAYENVEGMNKEGLLDMSGKTVILMF